MRRGTPNQPHRHSYLSECGMACLRKILMKVWMDREAVQTRVSEAARMAFAHPMAGDKLQERSGTHHVRGV